MTIQVQRSSIGGGDKKPCPSCGAEISTKARVCPECGTTLEAGWADQVQETRRSPILGTRGALICLVLAILVIVALTRNLWLPALLPNLSSSSTEVPTQSTGYSEPAATTTTTSQSVENAALPAWVSPIAVTELRLGPGESYPGIGIKLTGGLFVWAKEQSADGLWLRVCVTKVNCSTAAGWILKSALSIESSIDQQVISQLPIADQNSIPPIPSPTVEPTLEPTEAPTAVPTEAPTNTTEVLAEPTQAPQALVPTPTRRPQPPKPAIDARAAYRYFTTEGAVPQKTGGQQILFTVYTTSKDLTGLRACIDNQLPGDKRINQCKVLDGNFKALFEPQRGAYALFLARDGSTIISEVVWVDTASDTYFIDFGDGQRTK